MPTGPEQSLEARVERILAGDVRAVARALSRVENGSWTAESVRLLQALFPHAGGSVVLGFTGSPGAGKSTLVDQMARHYRRAGQKVGVVAIDPTSPFSGGAVLGDRIRMQALSEDPDVFIRSMATRGQLGGLAPAIHEALLVLDAAGFETLIVETVGVGQDEIDIVKTADVSVVILVPGMGDDIQTIKAGIMEIGDIFVINKADRDGVLRTEQEVDALLSISARPDGWHPPVVKTVATTGKGVPELAQAIAEYRRFVEASPAGRRRNSRLSRDRLLSMLRDRLSQLVLERIPEERLHDFAEKMMTRELDPYTIIDRLLDEVGLEEGK